MTTAETTETTMATSEMLLAKEGIPAQVVVRTVNF